MNNKFVRKVIVYAVSILIVCGIVGGGFAVKGMKEAAEEKALQESYEPPKAVMSQEEMEALYDEHKITDAVTAEVAGESPEEAAEEDGEAATTDNGVYEGCPVDFAGMWEINEDVYAWITVPGTVIDYPILQHATDNTYYLNYNIDGSYGYPGCIYTENMNTKDFTDNNTVIYGHNMKNGTMFAGLHKFEDAAFFEEHDKVIIYTPEKELDYTIYAAYIYDDRHLLYSFDFTDDAVFANYLTDMANQRSLSANFRKDVEVTSEDSIITLVTCMANQPEKRLLVQAVLEAE